MIRRRLAAFALALATFAGCHEDPKVQQVVVPGSATALAIFTDGGSGSTPTHVAGTGSNGGSLLARVLGELNLGGSTTIAAPTVPAAPTTGNAPLTSPTTGTLPTTTGTVIVSGNINVDTATSPMTIQTTNGDIVVSGHLRTVIAGATQNNIILSAPAGTVYVTGTIVASSSDTTDSGDSGGNVTINAARIVVTGTIDTRGEPHSSVPGTGGTGGNVSMTSTGGPIIITGSILTSGGTGTTGGPAGNVTLTAATALQLFGTVTADGGEATDSGAKPVGGDGGDLTLDAGASIDVSSTIQQRGGDANGGTQGADGGDGGTFAINRFIPVKIYGTLDLRGGTAAATSIGGGTLDGGAGGSIDLGNTGPALESLELGRGTWSTVGGSGVTALGNGGAIDLRAEDGTILFGSDLDTRGGSATGTAILAGGNGGAVTIMGDYTASAATNHVLAGNSAASVTTTGGAGSGTGNGGVGGAVTFQAGGDITLPIVITTTGGTAVTGTGGQAGAINITVDNAGVAPLGDVLMTGVLTALGGASTSGNGGTGGAVTVSAAASIPGEITSSADITTSGTNGVSGTSTGGSPGTVTFATEQGDISLSGTITANGGNSVVTPASATTISVTTGTTGGGITSSAKITASGGDSLASSLVNVAGGAGAAITFTVLNAGGTIRLETGTAITADGGTGTGISSAGAGGTVALVTLDQAVSISGSILLRGGNQSGAGLGGLGGQVAVITDSDNLNGKGDITLNSNGSIDVSSGTGALGGSARNNSGGAVDPGATPALIAVIFDAAGSFAASPDAGTEGVVRNLGSITARGRGTNGNGGDVYFDGMKAGGANLDATDAGTQTRTGTGVGLPGLFQPD